MTDWDLAKADYWFVSRITTEGKLVWRVFRGRGFKARPINDTLYPSRNAAHKAAVANYVVERVS